MNFYEYLRFYQSKGLRYGQSIFNALVQTDYETANSIRCTKDDPYYMDDTNAQHWLETYLQKANNV